MAQTTYANSCVLVHKSREGKSILFPDVCRTPLSSTVVPIPYIDIGMSSNTSKGTKSVKMDKKIHMGKGVKYRTCYDDEAGLLKGIVSSTTKGDNEFLMYSFDLKFDGKNIRHLGDALHHNKNNILS